MKVGILSWVIVGWIAGWLTGLVMRGKSYDVVGDIILGIISAVISGFLAAALLGAQNVVNGPNLPTMIISFLGALVGVTLIRAIARPTTV